jgi:hypothetical protein
VYDKRLEVCSLNAELKFSNIKFGLNITIWMSSLRSNIRVSWFGFKVLRFGSENLWFEHKGLRFGSVKQLKLKANEYTTHRKNIAHCSVIPLTFKDKI